MFKSATSTGGSYSDQISKLNSAQTDLNRNKPLTLKDKAGCVLKLGEWMVLRPAMTELLLFNPDFKLFFFIFLTTGYDVML